MGVARLRVYGTPVGEWKDPDPNGLQELSAAVNGGNIVGFNDAHYGDPWVILAPGRGLNMGDGWETRRRREPGNDWIVISLGSPGIVERIELDTAHFKGNYPDRCSVQGALIRDTLSNDILADKCNWLELMSQQKLEMDQIHNFNGTAIHSIGEVSHVRLNIFPDGGVSRFRIFGSPSNNDN
jgi:allantoicase